MLHSLDFYSISTRFLNTKKQDSDVRDQDLTNTVTWVWDEEPRLKYQEL